MASVNMSYLDPTTVTLIGIPGLEHVQFWIGFSFFVVVFRLQQNEARLKAFNTCTAHIFVFLEFYTLAFFSFFSHRFGHVAPSTHILLSTIYLLVPPALNPIVYGVKNKVIRKRVAQIFFLNHRS
ncbi:hypothetical protein HPG69_006226 [Diceros bicornis minor]|uniref:Uncharacterized protein n=1 Tax=Diceros bicornis minor TaxID=77932 RepID=A0A7J7F220_DICBM|nr:hypothetical protein HPG69_006226 [Diceros bicornis minor]